MKKIDIGCGVKKKWKGGYEGLDIKDFGQKYVCDVREGLSFTDDELDEIRCCHFVEHLTNDEAIAFLNECWRVIKPSGILYIIVPNALTTGGAFVLQHKSYWVGATFTDIARDRWEVYGIRPWKIEQLIIKEEVTIYCKLHPVKNENS